MGIVDEQLVEILREIAEFAAKGLIVGLFLLNDIDENVNCTVDNRERQWRNVRESCFRHPIFDLRRTRKVEIRHTNFHFSSKKVTSKSRKTSKS